MDTPEQPVIWIYGLAIDLMISLEGFIFQEIYERSVTFKDEELEIRVIHKNDLIPAKQKAGRSKDIDDVKNLQ